MGGIVSGIFGGGGGGSSSQQQQPSSQTVVNKTDSSGNQLASLAGNVAAQGQAQAQQPTQFQTNYAQLPTPQIQTGQFQPFTQQLYQIASGMTQGIPNYSSPSAIQQAANITAQSVNSQLNNPMRGVF